MAVCGRWSKKLDLVEEKRREATLKPLFKFLAVTLIVLLLCASGWLLFCRADLLVLCFCLTEAEREKICVLESRQA